MSSANAVHLLGNLGRAAELKYTPAGVAVATLSLATTEVWNDKASGQKKEETTWHRCIVWGKQAESTAEYLTKGKQVYIEGSIRNRQWEDKDGNKRTTSEIRVEKLALLGGGTGNGKAAAGGSELDGGDCGPVLVDDDPPF